MSVELLRRSESILGIRSRKSPSLLYFQQWEQRADEIGPVMTENLFRESISTFQIRLLHQFKIMNKIEYF